MTLITTLAVQGLFFFLLLLPFIFILFLIIPNRKYTDVLEYEIDEKIKCLNSKDRLSFNYKNVKVSLKRVEDKLLIEPYSNKIIESLLRVLGFFLAMFLVLIILAVVAEFLDSMGIGDKSFSDGTVRIVSWSGMLIFSAGEFWYIYVFIFYFFSKLIRKKVLNKLLIWKHKKNWNEFYLKYEQFRY